MLFRSQGDRGNEYSYWFVSQPDSPTKGADFLPCIFHRSQPLMERFAGKNICLDTFHVTSLTKGAEKHLVVSLILFSNRYTNSCWLTQNPIQLPPPGSPHHFRGLLNWILSSYPTPLPFCRLNNLPTSKFPR